MEDECYHIASPEEVRQLHEEIQSGKRVPWRSNWIGGCRLYIGKTPHVYDCTLVAYDEETDLVFLMKDRRVIT